MGDVCSLVLETIEQILLKLIHHTVKNTSTSVDLMTDEGLFITNLNGVSRALKAINELCERMGDGQEICFKLSDNLKVIYGKMKKLRDKGELPDENIMNQYFSLFRQLHAFLDKNNGRTIFYRLTKHCVMKREIERLIEGLNFLVKELGVQHFEEMSGWDANWDKEIKTQCINFKTIKNELNSTWSQREVLMTIDYEMNSHFGEYNTWTLEQMANLKKTLKDQLEIADIQTPNWFIPRERVDYVKEHFASGSFGTIHKGTWNGGAEIVVKCLRIDKNTGSHLHDKILSEMELWSGLNSPHITKMYGGSHVSSPPFIVCEYASNGNLSDYLRKYKHKMWGMLYEAALGLEYLHGKDTVHGDLKLNNILVGNDGKAKLTDFGLSAVRTSSRLSSSLSMNSSAGGGLRWRAPECSSAKKAGFESDVYSLGMCVIEAATGDPPFANLDDKTVIFQTQKGVIPAQPDSLDEEQWKLVVSMTCLVPSERITLKNVVKTFKKFAEAEKIANEEQKIRRCTACSAIMVWDARFCAKCGSQVNVGIESPTLKNSMVDKISQCVRWLTIGETLQKTQAVDTLQSFADEENYRRLIIAAGCVEPLIGLIKSDNNHQRDIATGILVKLVFYNNIHLKHIAELIGVDPLIDHLKHGNDLQKEKAAEVLAILAYNDDTNKVKIASAGGIKPLIELIRSGNDNQKEFAAGALSNLSSNSHNQKLIAATGGILPLIELVEQGTDIQKEIASGALLNLTMYANTRELIVTAGGIVALAKLLRSGNTQQQKNAIAALANIASCDDGIQSLIANANVIPSILGIIISGNDEQKESAALAIAYLTIDSSYRNILAESGGIIPLIELVTSGNDIQKENASEALLNLTIDVSNRDIIIAAGGITPLANLLMSGNEIQKENAVGALRHLLGEKYTSRSRRTTL